MKYHEYLESILSKKFPGIDENLELLLRHFDRLKPITQRRIIAGSLVILAKEIGDIIAKDLLANIDPDTEFGHQLQG